MELRFFLGFPRKIEDLLWKYRTSVDWSWTKIAWLMKRNNNSWWKWSWRSTLNNNSWTWLESSKSSTFVWVGLMGRNGSLEIWWFAFSPVVFSTTPFGGHFFSFNRLQRERKTFSKTKAPRKQPNTTRKTKRSHKTNNEYFSFFNFGLFFDFPTMKNSGQHVLFLNVFSVFPVFLLKPLQGSCRSFKKKFKQKLCPKSDKITQP